MRLVAVLAVLLVSASVAAQSGRSSDLHPYERSSSDGRHRLSVAPSHRDGSGSAAYTLTREGTVVWSGTKPRTFWDSIVTNDGFIAGYSYSEDGITDLADGDFHIVILDSAGAVKRDEVHERTSGWGPHDPSNPLARGVFEQPELKRVVFRIADEDIPRQHEQWWCYQLPDATEVFRKRPAEVTKDVGDAIVDVAAIAGTPLVAVQWRTFDWPRVAYRCAVLDPELNLVWKSEFLDEFDNRAPGKKDEALHAINQRGSISSGPGANRFSYGLAKAQTVIVYAVERSGHGWIVDEVARHPAGAPPKPAPKFADLPIVRLESRGDFSLAAPLPVDAAVRDIAAVAYAAGGEARLVRDEREGGQTFVRVDAAGRVLASRAIDLPDKLPIVGVRWWPLGPHTWLAAQSQYGSNATSVAWSVDEDTGIGRRLDAFECGAIENVAAFGDGRFVALEMTQPVLSAFDADGRKLWRIEGSADLESPDALFRPECVCVTTDGLVVVVDSLRHALQIYDDRSGFQRAVDLDAAWKREADYPTRVVADVEGGVIVHDPSGTPPLVRMTKDWSVRSELAPRFADGSVIDELALNARTAPDGRLWSHERQRLFRLDEKGVVDLVVGASRDPDVLAEPSAAAVDVLGRVLIQDESTGAIHVFDGRSGQRLFVCPPQPEIDAENSIAPITATRDRGVLIGAGSLSLRFGPDGASLHPVRAPEGCSALVYSPVGDGAFAGKADGGFVRLDRNLAEVAEFQRAPDGTWIRGCDPVVGPDGAVAVVNSTSAGLRLFAENVLLYDAADPKRGRSIPLPAETPSFCLSVGPTWLAVWSYGDEVLLVRRSDGRSQRFRVPGGEAGKRSFRFGFDPESGELIALHAEGRRIQRFALR